MNARGLNLVVLGIALGLLGIVIYLMSILLKCDPGKIKVVGATNVVTKTQIAVRKVNPTNFLSSLLGRTFHWSMLESTNYHEYIDRLRDFGCPEETIRDIIIAEVAQDYAQRRAAVRAQRPVPPYWESARKFNSHSDAVQASEGEMLALETEERTLVHELLGVSYDAEIAKYMVESRQREFRVGFLSPEKQSAVLDVLSEYEGIESGYAGGTTGGRHPLDAAELQKLERERDSELATLLTPDELFEFQVRNSTLARGLRSHLEGFDPSEQEFRHIFRLQKQMQDTLDQRFDPDDLKNEEIRNQVLQDAQAAYDAELKKELGQSRFNEYMRSQDQDYQALIQISDRLALAKTQVDKVYSMKVSAERERQSVVANPDLTEEQRQEALNGIAREAQRSVEAALGQDGYAAYRESAGDWILKLTEAPPPPPAPTQTPERVIILPPPPEQPPLPFPPAPPVLPR